MDKRIKEIIDHINMRSLLKAKQLLSELDIDLEKEKNGSRTKKT